MVAGQRGGPLPQRHDRIEAYPENDDQANDRDRDSECQQQESSQHVKQHEPSRQVVESHLYTGNSY